MNAREVLNNRLASSRKGWLDVETDLEHFALINYALPKSRLEKYIPSQYFEIPEFNIKGQKLALMSVVPFYDRDFNFQHFLPFIKFSFPQTNFRIYVINKKTNEYVAWFLGTVLGSQTVNIPSIFWKLPWHYAKFDFNCIFNDNDNRYSQYAVNFFSNWCNGNIDLEDTGENIKITEGFNDFDEMVLILTHPVEGYYYRKDNSLGTYSIWHDKMKLTFGRANRLYFSLLENLNLLTKDEMKNPHSVFMTPNIRFKIYLPPQRAHL